MSNLLQLLISGVTTGLIYALLGIAFVILYKCSSIFLICLGEILIIGAYLAWVFMVPCGFPIWLATLLALCCGGLIGYLVNRFTIAPLIGQPMLAMVMMTIILGFLLRGIAALVMGGIELRRYPAFFAGGGTFYLGSYVIPMEAVVTGVVAAVLLAAFGVFFQYHKEGLAMRAVSEDHQLAQSRGIKVNRIFSLAWVIAAILCVTSGILVGNISGIHGALYEVGYKVFPVVLLGGLESFKGAVIAGLIIGLSEALAVGYLDDLLPIHGGLGTVVPAIIMLLVLILKPTGLFGLRRIERI